MEATTLRVPAPCGLDFGMAILAELDDCGDWVKDAKEEVERALMERPERANLAEGLREPARFLTEQVGLLEQVLDGRADDGAFDVTAAPDVLAHVCETLARKIIPPRIGEATMVGPMEAESVAQVAALTSKLDWAVTEAVRLHGDRVAG